MTGEAAPRGRSDVEPIVRPASDQGVTPHRIVVVGGGAGGLELVTQLGDRLGKRGKAEVTLVERARTHLWKPLLHEVAAGSLDLDDHALDYLAQAHWHHFRYRIGELIGLDRAGKRVLLAGSYDDEGRLVTPERSFPYDTLVLAIGCRSNDFGTPGAKEHTISLDNPDEAARFNRRLVNACLRAHTQVEPVRPGQLHVAIIGAGATGPSSRPSCIAPPARLVAYRPRPDRPREGHQDHADRGRGPHRAGAAATPVRDDTAASARPRRRRAGRRPRHRGRAPTASARQRRLHPVRARGLGRGRARARRAGQPRRARGQPHQPAGGRRRRCRPRAIRTSSPSATAPSSSCPRPRPAAAAPRADRASAGQPCAQADPAPAQGRAAGALRLPRLRLAGLARASTARSAA